MQRRAYPLRATDRILAVNDAPLLEAQNPPSLVEVPLLDCDTIRFTALRFLVAALNFVIDHLSNSRGLTGSEGARNRLYFGSPDDSLDPAFYHIHEVPANLPTA